MALNSQIFRLPSIYSLLILSLVSIFELPIFAQEKVPSLQQLSDNTEPGTVASLVIPDTSNTNWLDIITGPPPPIAPEVITRDERGRATVRAIKLASGIRLDGQLDEQIYSLVPPISDLVQQVPDEGAPATEKTEAWIMFDSDNVYVAARVWDSAPPSEWVANEMRRDRGLMQNDTFGVVFDTYYDHRNGFLFYTTPIGALADQQFTNEGNPNPDWNPVWDVRTGRFENGWTVEMEIPFRSLRYRSTPPQVWGLQLRRTIRRKNEFNYLTPVQIGLGPPAIYRVSVAATLVGLETPQAGRSLEVKPYSIGGTQTNTETNPPQRNNFDGDFGVDVKYSVTQSLTADLSYNTDFAQVEVDEQMVNLTRFNMFFPEKREFFLEGQGIFAFGRGNGLSGNSIISGMGGQGGGGGERFPSRNVPILFFSRQIGLENGEIVPVLAGGRVTGKVGAFDVGALNIQTEQVPTVGIKAANFTALRVKRDILRRSAVGAIFTNRSVSLLGNGSSQTYGVDGTFAFHENVEFRTYYAKTNTPKGHRRNASHYTRFAYLGNLYSIESSYMVIEENFVPELGFVRRGNIKRNWNNVAFTPRPRSIKSIRQFNIGGRFDYVRTADTGVLAMRLGVLRFGAEFENSDRFSGDIANRYEFIEAPFAIGPNIVLPVGTYNFTDSSLSYTFGRQRKMSGSIAFRAGDFWNGNIKGIAFNQGRIAILEQFSIEPSMSINWINLQQGSFRTELVRTRFNYSFSPRMFLSGLVQYNSSNDSFSSNLRLRWEYTPGSELFIVYTDDYDTTPLIPDRFSELRSRGLVIKLTRLFQF